MDAEGYEEEEEEKRLKNIISRECSLAYTE